jgi:hypothetical protein
VDAAARRPYQKFKAALRNRSGFFFGDARKVPSGTEIEHALIFVRRGFGTGGADEITADGAGYKGSPAPTTR